MRPTDVNKRHAVGLAAGVLITMLTCGTAIAKPLDAEACAQLKSQRETLATPPKFLLLTPWRLSFWTTSCWCRTRSSSRARLTLGER